MLQSRQSAGVEKTPASDNQRLPVKRHEPKAMLIHIHHYNTADYYSVLLFIPSAVDSLKCSVVCLL